jgi:alpha-ribazole phosphatase/probable phosphoglycerate mutase
MKLPTKEECEKLLDEFEIPINIREHIQLVTKISVFLAKELIKKGENIDIELLSAASSLHDLDKLKSSLDRDNHGEISYELLKQKGFAEEFADLIKYHRGELVYPRDMSWELKILRYADARSLGNKIVSVDERMADLKARCLWFAKPENSDPVNSQTKNIETEIFSKIGIKPDDLKYVINKAPVRITYFVHGTTVDNEQGIASGWNNCELSDLGRKQSIGLNELFKDKKFDAIFCSDLKRAVDSAKLMFGDILGENLKTDNRLRECNYGDMNGAKSELVEGYDAISQRFPNGESYIDVEDRMKSFLKELLMKFPNKQVAIISHRAPQLAIEVLINKKSWQQAIEQDWRPKKAWQPGWSYYLEEI